MVHILYGLLVHCGFVAAGLFIDMQTLSRQAKYLVGSQVRL